MIADQQLLRGVAASARAAVLDTDGEPTAGLTLTVGLTEADGTEVVASGTSVTEDGDGIYSVALTASQVGSLELLLGTWTETSTGTIRARTVHEVVGGYYFTIAELKAKESSLAQAPVAELRSVRAEVESEFESICGVAFVPRYMRERLDGSGTDSIMLSQPQPRSVRSVRVYDGTNYTALSSDEIAALRISETGLIVRGDHRVFLRGSQNIVVEYEHGYDSPPRAVKRAGLRRARFQQHSGRSGIPDRAINMTSDQGVTYRIAMPGETHTGDPEVDSVLDRYSQRIHLGIA